jgi:hypothetical protein
MSNGAFSTSSDVWDFQFQNQLDKAYYSVLLRENQIRVDEQEKQFKYYAGDFADVKKMLLQALKLTWDEFSIKRMPKSYVNITDKIIDSLSIIYKNKPKRRVFNDDGTINEDLTQYYEKILPANSNKIDKETQRIAKLHNCSVPFMTFDPLTKRFKQRVSPSYLYNVYPILETSDSQNIGKITYNKYFYDDQNDNYKLYTVVWTDDEYFRIFQNGDPVPMPGMDDIENPFGIIPVPFMRFKSGEDFWGEGQNILVNENEQINVLLSKLNYDDLILGTGGILFGVDLGELKTNMTADGAGALIGGRDVIFNTKSSPDGVKIPSLSFVSTNPQVAEVTRAIDWKIKMIAQSMGLNPNNFTTELKAESGFAKIVASFEQGEVRTDDLPSCDEYEQRRFDIIRKMNNALKNSSFKGTEQLVEIPEDVTLRVDFAEIDMPKTADEMWRDRAERESRLMGNNIDWTMQDNPDILNRDEAIEILTSRSEEQSDNPAVIGTKENKPTGITLNDLLGEEEEIETEEEIGTEET